MTSTVMNKTRSNLMLAKNIESYRNYTSFVVHGSVLLIRGAQSAISEDQKLSLSEEGHVQELCVKFCI